MIHKNPNPFLDFCIVYLLLASVGCRVLAVSIGTSPVWSSGRTFNSAAVVHVSKTTWLLSATLGSLTYYFYTFIPRCIPICDVLSMHPWRVVSALKRMYSNGCACVRWSIWKFDIRILLNLTFAYNCRRFGSCCDISLSSVATIAVAWVI